MFAFLFRIWRSEFWSGPWRGIDYGQSLAYYLENLAGVKGRHWDKRYPRTIAKDLHGICGINI